MAAIDAGRSDAAVAKLPDREALAVGEILRRCESAVWPSRREWPPAGPPRRAPRSDRADTSGTCDRSVRARHVADRPPTSVTSSITPRTASRGSSRCSARLYAREQFPDRAARSSVNVPDRRPHQRRHHARAEPASSARSRPERTNVRAAAALRRRRTARDTRSA